MSKTRWASLGEESKSLLVHWLNDEGCPDPECLAMPNEPHIPDCTFVKWALEAVESDG